MLPLHAVIQGLRTCLAAPPEVGQELQGFSRVVIDSRQVGPGDLFVALQGEREDGHDYMGQALAKGAKGIIAERRPEGLPEGMAPGALFLVKDTLGALQGLARFWRARHRLEVVGVTGSVGKTTAKEAIAAVLGEQYCVLKSPGNLNSETGLPLSLLTLESFHQIGVLEMGMYGLGEIATLCAIAQPRIGVVTNVGPSHLERLGSMEAIAKAKGELVESLPSSGVAILNGDDPRVRAMTERTSARCLLYGEDPSCDLWADEVVGEGLQGLHFRLHWAGESRQVLFSLPGRHNLSAALAAAAVGFTLGLSWEQVIAGLGKEHELRRMKVYSGPGGSTILDDTYNASPASTLAALDLLAEMKGRRIAVLGDMLELGAYEEEGHRSVGRRATQVADVLIVIGTLAQIMGQEAQICGLPEVYFASSKEQAEAYLAPQLRPGDYLLIKGSRGMELESIVEHLRRG